MIIFIIIIRSISQSRILCPLFSFFCPSLKVHRFYFADLILFICRKIPHTFRLRRLSPQLRRPSTIPAAWGSGLHPAHYRRIFRHSVSLNHRKAHRLEVFYDFRVYRRSPRKLSTQRGVVKMKKSARQSFMVVASRLEFFIALVRR